jgi:hypothetical protein
MQTSLSVRGRAPAAAPARAARRAVVRRGSLVVKATLAPPAKTAGGSSASLEWDQPLTEGDAEIAGLIKQEKARQVRVKCPFGAAPPSPPPPSSAPSRPHTQRAQA